MLTDGEECPSDGGSACSIAFLASERVRGSSRLEEDECEEHKDLGPDTGRVSVCVDTNCLKEREHDENNGP